MEFESITFKIVKDCSIQFWKIVFVTFSRTTFVGRV